MRLGLTQPSSLVFQASFILWSVARSTVLAASNQETSRSNSPELRWESTFAPGTGPSISARAVRDTSFLPVQIGGIVAAYGVSLVLVAITLLSLAKKRREHLEAEAEVDYPFVERIEEIADKQYQEFILQRQNEPPDLPPLSIPQTGFGSESNSQLNFSTATPVTISPGVDLHVDQSIVAADRAMAQSQLEEMYRHVMEHEDAKERGVMLEMPMSPVSHRASAMTQQSAGAFSKKSKAKPSSLNLTAAKEDKSQSKASALFSAILSPKKKNLIKGVSISSPIMTPMSGTFPRHESQEMGTLPHRHYAPPQQVPAAHSAYAPSINSRINAAPDISPESSQSIDERIGFQLDRANQSRSTLPAGFDEREPDSATSESHLPLVGLPTSPKPGARFPSLPASPKPGATFQRPNPSSAVRANGALPLRAYSEGVGSVSVESHVTKQTVFERKGPLSPSGLRTPFTANAVPYSPYQPFTPCVPVTPSLVTKEDRKRMRRMVPKTPTLEMVRSADDVW